MEEATYGPYYRPSRINSLRIGAGTEVPSKKTGSLSFGHQRRPDGSMTRKYSQGPDPIFVKE
jgi:hypothetical protein